MKIDNDGASRLSFPFCEIGSSITKRYSGKRKIVSNWLKPPVAHFSWVSYASLLLTLLLRTSASAQGTVDACKVVANPRTTLDTITPQTAEISQGDQILSPNQQYSLTISKSGEVKLCARDFSDQCKCNNEVWSSDTGVRINQLLNGNQTLNKLVMQGDGNIGIYTRTATGKSLVICASGSSGPPGRYILQMNNDGTAAASGPAGIVWTSSNKQGFKCASQIEVNNATNPTK